MCYNIPRADYSKKIFTGKGGTNTTMEPRRTIRVKATGSLSQAPDQVTIFMTLVARHKDYSEVVELIADKIAQLRKTIAAVGFDLDELKTESFYVDSNYEDMKIKEAGKTITRRVLIGYSCTHHLELTFDFVTENLNRTIVALNDCPANPKISIRFSIKDATELNDRLWEFIAENARHKAEILCKASGVRLGKLLSIGCGPDDFYTGFLSDSLFDGLAGSDSSSSAMSEQVFVPKGIEVKDSVDFYWEILD